MNVNEQNLIEQARKDPQAFAALYDRYVDRIFGYSVRLVREEALAQDVTAVTFEKALRNLQKYEWQGHSFAAWLYRIAHNEAVSQMRKRKWLAPWRDWGHTSPQPAPETAVLAAERDQELYTALDQLADKDREILILRFFEGLSSEETAEVLGCSKANVYVRLHRALKRLEKELHFNQTWTAVRGS